MKPFAADRAPAWGGAGVAVPRREASARALSFCAMFSFTKHALSQLLSMYPEVSDAMQSQMEARLRKWRLKRVVNGKRTDLSDKLLDKARSIVGLVAEDGQGEHGDGVVDGLEDPGHATVGDKQDGLGVG